MFKKFKVANAAVLSVAMIALVTPVSSAQAASASSLAVLSKQAGTNPAPIVVPSLREWTGGNGSLVLPSKTVILASPGSVEVAKGFAADLQESTGLVATAVPSPAVAKSGGNVVLNLDASDSYAAGGQRYAAEGYKISITAAGVEIKAPSTKGLFYGTRSILQILNQSKLRKTLPLGTTVDWPDYASRGFSLDVGRRFFTATFIRDYIKMMSYYKLNEFQIHLNDNEIFREDGDWRNGQSAFRLASDNPAFAGLAAKDGSYNRADWNSFEDTAAAHALTIVPEIDAPAHAAAIIKWRPEIGLNGGKSDHLDLSKPLATQTMKDIFAEFTPWFRGKDVHLGADEYPREFAAEYKAYYNIMAAYIRSLGKHPRAWGSATVMQGSLDGFDHDVTVQHWNNDWYSPESAVADKVKWINSNDGALYVVPFANYYNGQGLNNVDKYNNWQPNPSGGPSTETGAPLGAIFAVWNDLVSNPYTQADVDGLVKLSFPTLAQKMWKASTPKVSFADFSSALNKIGRGPGLSNLQQLSGSTGDLALGKTATSSQTADGRSASQAVDGKELTRWESAGVSDAELTIDLGATKAIGGVEADWAVNLPSKYTVSTSSDGVNWSVRGTFSPATTVDKVSFDTVQARYIKLNGFHASAGQTSVSAWRVSVFEPRNLALGAVATASGSETASFGPELAVDGNSSTRWSSNYTPTSWISVDLGQNVSFDRVTLSWEQASAKDFTVEVSDDGVTWRNAATRTGQAAGARVDKLDIARTNARYVRVSVSVKSMPEYLSMYELVVQDMAG